MIVVDRVELTPREREVLREIAAGKSRGKIARALDITIHTVDFHIRSIAGKLPGNGRPLRKLTAAAFRDPDLLDGPT